jgi:tetratricopeptide (TPR) repeat protein
MRRSYSWLLLAVLALPAPILADHANDPPAAGHASADSARASAPSATPTASAHGMPAAGASARTAVEIKGLGPLQHPVSTSVPEAQRFFDQGLRLCYAFNHDEAILSFRRAAELDPKLAMAWWGIALANGPNINLPMDADHERAALMAIREAQNRLDGASEAERTYIAALALRYAEPAGEQRAARDSAYAQAMDDLRRRYPEDLDAITLWAESMMDLRPWNYWNADGSPAPRTMEVVEAVEGVLAKDPKHIGANHLHIHLLEAADPKRALKSADRMVGLAPAAGHLEHMPTHIYTRLGWFEKSGDINAKAARVDREYITRDQPTGVYPYMYFFHNVHFAAYAYSAIGRYAQALPYAKEVSSRSAAAVKDMPMLEVFTPTELLIAIRCRRWKDVLSVPDPGESMPYTRAIRHFGRAMAEAAAGRAGEAREEQRLFESASAATPITAPIGLNPAGLVLRVPSHLLAGRLAELENRHEDAGTHYRAAVATEDSVMYDEPPDWYLHARETLGGYHLRRRAFTEAEAVFRADLAKNPGNPRSLFGLAEALKGLGRTQDASKAATEFRKAWSKADTKLTSADL